MCYLTFTGAHCTSTNSKTDLVIVRIASDIKMKQKLSQIKPARSPSHHHGESHCSQVLSSARYIPLSSLSCRFPGCPCDDICWIWLPDDISETLQFRRSGFQLPDRSLRPPVGPADARLVPLSGLHRWQDQNRG